MISKELFALFDQQIGDNWQGGANPVRLGGVRARLEARPEEVTLVNLVNPVSKEDLLSELDDLIRIYGSDGKAIFFVEQFEKTLPPIKRRRRSPRY